MAGRTSGEYEYEMGGEVEEVFGELVARGVDGRGEDGGGGEECGGCCGWEGECRDFGVVWGGGREGLWGWVACGLCICI